MDVFIIGVQADDLEIFRLIFFFHFDEMRHLAAARSAPRRPEIEKNDVSLFVFQLKRTVIKFFDFGLRQRGSESADTHY